ncbi:MAG: hypothetical protein JWR18_2185, partial [Segetibacter sp.]|nr:hypothetical protein [Segetibacter sp.]
ERRKLLLNVNIEYKSATQEKSISENNADATIITNPKTIIKRAVHQKVNSAFYYPMLGKNLGDCLAFVACS